jgi:hypothetical protein
MIPLSLVTVTYLPTAALAFGRSQRARNKVSGSLAQQRPECVIPQRCADAVVSRRKLMMSGLFFLVFKTRQQVSFVQTKRWNCDC